MSPDEKRNIPIYDQGAIASSVAFASMNCLNIMRYRQSQLERGNDMDAKEARVLRRLGMEPVHVEPPRPGIVRIFRWQPSQYVWRLVSEFDGCSDFRPSCNPGRYDMVNYCLIDDKGNEQYFLSKEFI